MLKIVQSIYKMTDQMVQLPEDENTAEKVMLSFSDDLDHSHNHDYSESTRSLQAWTETRTLN